MAAPKETADIWEATSTGVVAIRGTRYTYIRGKTRVRAGHPLLKAAPDKFRPAKLAYDVEQTTAAPGEKRGA
jgi:hypothetical protein